MNLLHNKMDTISGRYYIVDNKFYSSENIDFQFNISDYHTYEVLRSTKGVLIFLIDHIERMKEGVEKLDKNARFSRESAIKNLNLLIQQSENFEGNVKLLAKLEKQNVLFAAYGIPHHYPDMEKYREGVLLRTIPLQRPNPLVKQVHVANSILERIKQDQTFDIYESLLVDQNGYITEGSKSNFFLVQGHCIFSAPEENILHGITRKYVLNIAKDKGISIIHKKILENDLGKFDAAFICGTSPKILPIKKVNDTQYDPEHPILKILIESYDTILEDYILKHNSSINSYK